MAGKDIIMVRQKELKRLHVIHRVLEGEITGVQASEMLSLSERQIRRIAKRIREEGNSGIVHKSRGKECNRKLPKKLIERVVYLYQHKYEGFGPTLFCEKLSETEGIHISDETARTWLIEAGQWKKGRKRRTHRQWRPRKGHYGEMVQMDGSHHNWFEDRSPKCVLMAYIDDASGRVYGRFYEYEGTMPAMDSFKRYIKRHGIAISIYFDRHTTYKSPSEPSIEDEINGTEPLSEFGRALRELNIELIHAYSPQAKGRVERLFATLQDRLVKELRIRGLSTIEEANIFLEKSYWADFNKRFMVKAQYKEDIHRAVPKELNLDKILCIRTERTVRNDNTITHNSKFYQLKEAFPKKAKIVVQERVDGSMIITHQEVRIKYKEIDNRPEKVQQKKRKTRRKVTYRPPSDHPWRKLSVNEKKIWQAAA